MESRWRLLHQWYVVYPPRVDTLWALTDNFSVSIGTPPQILTVLLDTGSSDLYVDAASAEACQDPSASNSCRGGIFDPTASQTYHLVGPGEFQTSFGDGSAVAGDFATDVVGIGAVELTNVQFGVASSINSTTGYAISLMGVGYSANEASAPNYYPNMPDLLQQAGAINSRLYSIFLNQYGMRVHSTRTSSPPPPKKAVLIVVQAMTRAPSCLEASTLLSTLGSCTRSIFCPLLQQTHLPRSPRLSPNFWSM